MAWLKKNLIPFRNAPARSIPKSPRSKRKSGSSTATLAQGPARKPSAFRSTALPHGAIHHARDANRRPFTRRARLSPPPRPSPKIHEPDFLRGRPETAQRRRLKPTTTPEHYNELGPFANTDVTASVLVSKSFPTTTAHEPGGWSATWPRVGAGAVRPGCGRKMRLAAATASSCFVIFSDCRCCSERSGCSCTTADLLLS